MKVRALLESNPSVDQLQMAPKKGTALQGRDAFLGAICPHSLNSGVWGSELPPKWWPGGSLQIPARTIDDATRSIVGGGFIEAETTFAHLDHVRKIFQIHGLPNDFYTDGLSLFGHESRKAGDTKTLSQFQRALGCLGVNHLVAKDPQSKGKIERQSDFWQKRLPGFFCLEGAATTPEQTSCWPRKSTGTREIISVGPPA